MSGTSVPARGSSRGRLTSPPAGQTTSRLANFAKVMRTPLTPPRPWAIKPIPTAEDRPTINGKYFFVGTEKLWVRGVTYGAFLADADGREYQDLYKVERDFQLMAASGLNAVRIPHTTPPRELLDIASDNGLRVMVGLSAEQYAGFLVDRSKAPDIEAIVRDKVLSVAGHPALLCYGLGNEIQAPLARWIGRRRLERYLERMYEVVKDVDPEGLVTYVNYPSTEYLSLPFLDFHCCNVYLETRDKLSGYLARLQNAAGDRPLLMGELGLDSMRNGEEKQAHVLDWQIRTSFAEGCAGAFVFAWTDEWYRGKERVEDWAFGLTRHDRSPKPALAAVTKAFSQVPFLPERKWPSVSVIVCTHNGAATIRECLKGLQNLDYPDYEVIVVNDGSRDATAEAAAGFDVKLITTKNMGLSSARNTGLHAASGEIVAYIDDDAYPDAHWLKYLADTYVWTDNSAVGGPNIPPGDGGVVADAVENAPGGPMHVLISDRIAEHIPGCNMTFRREALLAIGGFDAQFRTAGDDVDVCWRLLERGWTIGFNPGAVVMHHRRKSVRSYWKQQWGYGKAEARLEKKWPEKYNSVGHVAWAGRLYGKGQSRLPGFTGRIYHGVWGVAPFQLLYQPSPTGLAALPLMPEWYLLGVVLAAASALGVFWPPLLAFLPLFLITLLGAILRAVVSASSALFPNSSRGAFERFKRITVTTFLYWIQPMARLGGRLRDGLHPFRSREAAGFALPWPRGFRLWTDGGAQQEERLATIEQSLRESGTRVVRGGAYDHWDLDILGGIFGGARLRMAVEDHGGGHQFVRVRYWPQWRRLGLFVWLQIILGLLTGKAGIDRAPIAIISLSAVSLVLSLLAIQDCAGAIAALAAATSSQKAADEPSRNTDSNSSVS